MSLLDIVIPFIKLGLTLFTVFVAGGLIYWLLDCIKAKDITPAQRRGFVLRARTERIHEMEHDLNLCNCNFVKDPHARRYNGQRPYTEVPRR